MNEFILYSFLCSIPLLFFIGEALYFVNNRCRAHYVVRLPFELAAMVIYPIIFFDIDSDDVIRTIGIFKFDSDIRMLIILFIGLPCFVAYMLSAYRRRVYPPLTEAILNIMLIAGIILNIILFIYVSVVYLMPVAIIGNLPIIIAFSIALVRNLWLDPETDEQQINEPE